MSSLDVLSIVVLYQDARVSEGARTAYPSLAEYLHSLNLRADIARVDPTMLARGDLMFVQGTDPAEFWFFPTRGAALAWPAIVEAARRRRAEGIRLAASVMS